MDDGIYDIEVEWLHPGRSYRMPLNYTSFRMGSVRSYIRGS